MGHLCCVITDVPPQPNSHSASVLYDCVSPPPNRLPDGNRPAKREKLKVCNGRLPDGRPPLQDSRHGAQRRRHPFPSPTHATINTPARGIGDHDAVVRVRSKGAPAPGRMNGRNASGSPHPAGTTPRDGRSGIAVSGGATREERKHARESGAAMHSRRTNDARLLEPHRRQAETHRPSSETSTRWQCHCTVSQPNRQVAVFHGRTEYCLLRSSPCRPDDNNRLESSSKGSSCPAVAQ